MRESLSLFAKFLKKTNSHSEPVPFINPVLDDAEIGRNEIDTPCPPFSTAGLESLIVFDEAGVCFKTTTVLFIHKPENFAPES